ncbi:M20 family metallopeptidase [Pseudoalteromonas tunicata]|uniref:M20 family metallopeptidase n=1 Tax=Pseudoalteromonas tunicata TaxID=314281 RepID=UPI00273DEFB5|nr:M20 family metallopeptidase [Pseudoalteromonas tunicata]MDP4985191.1 M20 family metallopeptidase [Pseudoalteromonas tunicata]
MSNGIDFSELAKMVNCNSHSKNKTGIDENAEIFKAWMQPLGFSCQTFAREHIGNHLLFSSPKRLGKKILLLGHLDTVFPQGTFCHFSEDAQWVYGPGVCDMKGGNFVALNALRKVKTLLGDIINIDMLLVSDEETGSDDSKQLSSKLAKNYDYCFVFEAAGKNHEIVTARKGVATFTIDITGKAAHAGNHYQAGINANLAAAKMLIELTELTDLSQNTTVNVGKMSGGIGANTISPSAQLIVEARFTCAYEKLRLLESIAHLVDNPRIEGIEVAISGGVQRDVMAPTKGQTELVTLIGDIIGYPFQTEARGGVSDANTMAAAGLVTLDGFGPYGDGDHTINERAEKASFARRIHEMSQILLHFCPVTRPNSQTLLGSEANIA